tara:strand:+ start:65 stop:265 length:201 start_codon:yes stop_codon:yes gene_type:complete
MSSEYKPYVEVVAELSHDDIRDYISDSEKYLWLDYVVFMFSEERISDERADHAEELIEERIKKESI